jgi:hypothetical protein
MGIVDDNHAGLIQVKSGLAFFYVPEKKKIQVY